MSSSSIEAAASTRCTNSGATPAMSTTPIATRMPDTTATARAGRTPRAASRERLP
jgi:hypothetical protein